MTIHVRAMLIMVSAKKRKGKGAARVGGIGCG